LKLSIVILTMGDRPDELRRAVESTAALRAAGAELIVVGNGADVPPVPDGVFREQKIHPLGAFHQAEIVYVFGTLDTRNWMWTDTDRKLSGVMMAYWTNFAKTGDPNGANLPKWIPSDPENDVVMGFGDMIGMRPGPSKAALAFWDSFYSTGSPAD